MIPPKDSSRKTKKAESGPATRRKPPFPDARKGGHSLARRRPPGSFNPPRHKKLSKGARIALGGIAAAAALSLSPAADAKNAPSLISKASYDHSKQPEELPIWYACPPDSYQQPQEGESISSILRGLKEETEKLKDENGSFVVKKSGNRVRVTHIDEDKELHFEVTEMGPLAPAGGKKWDFYYNYRYMDLDLVDFRIDKQEGKFVLYGIDVDSRRMLEMHVPFSIAGPGAIELYTVEDNADEHYIEFVFQALANLPEAYSEEEDWKSRKIAHAIGIGENTLAKRVSELDFGGSVSSSEDFEKSLDRAIDEYVWAYADTMQPIFKSIAAEMETLSPEKASELADFAIPRLSAILLRPHAANIGPSILRDLDDLISGPDFSMDSLRSFAWHNGLRSEFNQSLRFFKSKFGEIVPR
ncbi:hypothetical protein GF415_02710 [Candidatus Micrarchaeota archaeon]|nr:hypothetical protein [Candidatus Micrarchaeota archaeon]